MDKQQTVFKDNRRAASKPLIENNSDTNHEFDHFSCTMEPFYTRKSSFGKRMLDISGSLTVLILLSPLLITISILIKIVSPGPVLFKQSRVGYGGKEFKFLKFRTMHCNADTSAHQKYLADLIKCESASCDKPMIKIKNDPRIFKFGYFLRETCLDELPQLINVLRNEMSLVGPRPPIPYEVREYSSWHHGRFDCMPGMTGLWQVNGKNKLSFRDMIRLDIQYSRRFTIWMDLLILLKTPFIIISGLFDNIKPASSQDGGISNV